MNNRLTAQDIAGLLAEYTGKDKKEAERFLREFVGIVMESVFTDKMVKIKGLGTFKVISVEKRESIHVNTGERFLIPEHYKFSFAPDKELKDMVNKPFSFFETTELNENADLSDTDQSEEEEMSGDVDDESVEEILPEVEQLIEEPKEEITEEAPEEPIQEKVESEQEETKEPPVEEKKVEQSPEKTDEPQSKTINEHVKYQEYSSPDIHYMQDFDHNSHSFLKRIVIVLFTFALVGIAGAYFFFDFKPFIDSRYGHNKKLQEPNMGEELDKPFHTDSLDMVTADYNNDTLAIKQTDTIIPDVTTPKEEVKKPEAVKPAVNVQPEKSELARIKIKTGDRLTLIALEYYGSKIFWVYLYEHNKDIISNPNNVPVGTEIVVPSPELYGIDVHNRSSVENAAALQTQILSDKE